jgi:hypothetical protein
MAAQFRHLQRTYGFQIIDGHRSVEEINTELQKKIEAVLTGNHKH